MTRGIDQAKAAQVQRLRDALAPLMGWRDGAETTADGSADNDLAAERVEAVLTFAFLAQHHTLPRKLLPYEDRQGDWYAPGERVTVLGRHPGTVEPRLDLVRVKMDGMNVATEFPRTALAREGEQWMPPKPTRS